MSKVSVQNMIDYFYYYQKEETRKIYYLHIQNLVEYVQYEVYDWDLTD